MTYIVLYLGLAVSLFIVRDISYHTVVATLISFSLFLLMPLKKAMGGLVPIFFFLFFTFVGNLLFHPGKILFGSGLFSITDEGLAFAEVRTLRVFSMIYGAKIMTFLLPLDEMIQAMDRILSPLEKTGMPVKEFFSIMGLTVQSFPRLTQYMAKTYQEDREQKEVEGFRNRLRHLVSCMAPIFRESIRSPERFFITEEDVRKDGQEVQIR